MAWPSGMIGAPNAPCATRARISASRLPAMPHSREVTVKPITVKNIRLRQPSRLASQPVIGVATAVATRFSVITQEISSWVADRLPRICGSTRLASVMVMPNSMLASWTINRMSHCRPLIVKRPPFSVLAASAVLAVVSAAIPVVVERQVPRREGTDHSAERLRMTEKRRALPANALLQCDNLLERRCDGRRLDTILTPEAA